MKRLSKTSFRQQSFNVRKLNVAEIEFRLAGVYYYLAEENKAEYHLKNGLIFEQEFTLILEELFPAVFKMKSVKEIIKEHQNPSL